MGGMTEQLTTLETILQKIVNESDPVMRSELADRYAAELRLTLRTISSRSMGTLWSEKEDILEQVGDTNTLVSRLLQVLEDHTIESREYRTEAVGALKEVQKHLRDYIALVPPEEHIALMKQIAEHELRITALENDADGDKS
jgi:hypothetical protein